MNVWLALVHEIHPHHGPAAAWGESLHDDSPVCFCRFTQLGLLRLLTNRSAMGADVLTQAEAWEAFDLLLANSRNLLLDEPAGIDPPFRRHTNRREVSTKQWADGYLTAFAEAADLTLVTFDRALAGKARGAVLLSA